MKYILDTNSYIEEVVFGASVECNNKSCTEYTGNIPDGYTSLENWADSANIRAYKVTDRNLVYDSEKDAELQAKWQQEASENKPVKIKLKRW